ncbi:hypothetical protein [Pseudoteredinibacter isoporae]|uniref:hypothetical protein n=1 Tax=Pseudoteredinibacter isoporae TaxID=570281 RepID=UPI0031060A9E
MLLKKNIQPILEKVGFVDDTSAGYSDRFKIDLKNGWFVSAYCSYSGNFFDDNIDKEKYEKVSVSLDGLIGTTHIFNNEKALERNLLKILETLKENSDNEEILKCPECGRYVNPKTPKPGDTWKPFLSCSGMQVVGTGKSKQVLCKGTSKKLPAIVNHH